MAVRVELLNAVERTTQISLVRRGLAAWSHGDRSEVEMQIKGGVKNGKPDFDA